MHDGVRLERHGRLDPGRARVDDRHPGEHVRAVDAVAQELAGERELDPRVDPLRLVRVGRDVHGDALTGVDEPADGIGEVELALGVGRRQALERRPEGVRPEHVDGRVRLAHLELLGRRVARLHDRGEVAVGVPEHAAVAQHVVGDEREHRGGGAGCAVRIQKPAEQLGREQRRVAREDEHLVGVPDGLARRADGVAGPERLLLHGDLEAGERVRRRGRRDDHERVGAERPRRLDDPVDHPAPENRVEVLHEGRLHARAEPSGHDHRGKSGRHRPCPRRWLGRQDSNLGSRDQNPLPYRLATPQSRDGSLPGGTRPAGASAGRAGARRARAPRAARRPRRRARRARRPRGARRRRAAARPPPST